MKRVVAAVAGLAVVVAAIAIGVVALSDDGTDRPTVRAGDAATAVEHEYVIPDGMGDAIDAGEPFPEVIPATLEIAVGESIRIVNHDTRGHTVGAFYVGAGETLTQTFASPGELGGDCTIHPSGAFTLSVVG